VPSRIALFALIVVATSMFVSSCDNFVEYTVVNDTDQDLLTWASTRDCGAGVGKKEDYTETEVVPRRSTYHYGHSNFEPLQCAHVATIDRRLVLSDDRTNHGATFTITEPVSPQGDPIPERNQLPGRKPWHGFRNGPPIYWALTALLAAGVLWALFLSARALFRLRWRQREV